MFEVRSMIRVSSFICHDGGPAPATQPGAVGQRRNNNFTFSKQFSASALKFTG